MKRLRFILLGVLAAVLLGAGLAGLLHEKAKLPEQASDDGLPVSPDGRPRVRGLTYTQVENGVRKWTLAASGARYDGDSGRVALMDVRVEFYQERGGTVTLQAKEGEYDQKAQLVTLRGQVRGRTHDGKTLTTELITYSEIEQLVDTDAEVTIAGPGFNVRGRGFLVEVPQNVVVFKNQVHSTFVPRGQGPPPGATAEGS